MRQAEGVLLAAVAAAAWCAAPLAQTAAQQQQGQATQAQGQAKRSALSNSEKKFLEKAAQHSKAEVEAGKLAESKATNPEAKKFGQQMVQDHGKAYDEAVQLAKSKAVSVPAEPDSSHKREAKNLEKLSGAEFDRKYMAAMVKDHEADVKEFRKMAKEAKDPDVKTFAEKSLPVLESHLQLARQVASATTGAKR
jgi:putative membrane protein